MTYRLKRERAASTAPRAYMSGDATHDSQPTKKQANERTSQVPTTTVKWGPFSPPAATKVKVVPPSLNTSTSAQMPMKDNKVGAIWKNPPTGTSSSQKAPASTYNSHKAPSPNVPTTSNAPPSNAPGNLKTPTLSSHKVAEEPSGFGKETPPTLSSMSLPNIPPSITSKSLKYPSKSSFNSDQPSSLNLLNSNEKSRKEDVNIETEEKNCEETKKSSKLLKSLRSKSHPDWPMTVDDFDDKEEVLTVDANGNVVYLSGSIQPIDVWSNNGVRFYVEFNELYQPIRKGGHILIRFLGNIAKIETYCPLGEEDWHAIDEHFKKMIINEMRDRFVIPIGELYNKAALKRVNKSWRQYKFNLKKDYYKPTEKTLEEMCSATPPHGISSQNWVKLLKYWDSEKGKSLATCGKAARASLNQLHRCGSNSFANKQADHEDEHGEKMSLLALWIKAHTGKDGSFLPGTVTEDFVDDAKAKVEQLRLINPSKSQQELEDEAFELTMHGGEIPDRPTGYGLGVRKSDIYGVHALLRKDGSRRIKQRTVVMDSNVKEEMSALHKKNEVLEKENEKLKDQVQENNILLKTLIGQFSQIVGGVNDGKGSTELLNCAKSVLGVTNQQVMNATGEQGKSTKDGN
ncbi:uncharacterized protein LOC110720933 isoform X2 [Chenopodium quinoa]|nr:uncharacterized protein LOC110720933 isoform X2 [Chenopodium quinoa]